MALQRITHIEGLEAFEDVQLQNDTDPGANQISFSVESEEMPYLTMHPEEIPEEERQGHVAGQIFRRNYVWIRKICNLGNSIIFRRICDTVKFDKDTGKWKVIKLAPAVSDIKDYPAEWNAFATSAKEGAYGTPLEMIFKNDPSRAIYYKNHHITTVEQLSKCSESDIQMLGLGGREDVKKAIQFMEVAKEAAPGIALNKMVEAKDRQIASLESRLADLSEKLEEVLKAQIGELGPKPKKAVKRKAPITETLEAA